MSENVVTVAVIGHVDSAKMRSRVSCLHSTRVHRVRQLFFTGISHQEHEHENVRYNTTWLYSKSSLIKPQRHRSRAVRESHREHDNVDGD